MIAFLMIAGLGVLALLSRLAALTRMTIPLLYTVSMLTVFHGWYRAHTVLADRILFALVGLVVLSWLLSLIRFVCDLVIPKLLIAFLEFKSRAVFAISCGIETNTATAPFIHIRVMRYKGRLSGHCLRPVVAPSSAITKPSVLFTR